MSRVVIHITRNFRRNLEEIREFLNTTEAEGAFDALLDDLFAAVLPRLESLPDIGSDFSRRRPTSRESADMLASLRQRMGPESQLRELIHGHYILLYARQQANLYLLAIRHHRQLSFDFVDRWLE